MSIMLLLQDVNRLMPVHTGARASTIRFNILLLNVEFKECVTTTHSIERQGEQWEQ